jgi:hypothetical protein
MLLSRVLLEGAVERRAKTNQVSFKFSIQILLKRSQYWFAASNQLNESRSRKFTYKWVWVRVRVAGDNEFVAELGAPESMRSGRRYEESDMSRSKESSSGALAVPVNLELFMLMGVDSDGSKSKSKSKP